MTPPRPADRTPVPLATSPSETAKLAHDLSNLLTIIHGCCFRLAERTASDAVAYDLVRMIESVAQEASGMTRRLAEMSSRDTRVSLGRQVHSMAILVIEVDDLVRELMVETLRAAGHIVSEAAEVDTARRVMAATRESWDVLVMDECQNGISGWDLAAEFAATRAGLQVVFVSGSGEVPHTNEGGQKYVYTQLAKPFTARDLLGAVAGFQNK